MDNLQSYKSTPKDIFLRYKSLLIVTAILAVLPLALGSSQYLIHAGVMMLWWGYMATAWNVMGGLLGHYAMGNGIYMAVGAYVTGALFKYAGMSPWLGMIVAALITCVISCLAALPCFRLRGTYYALSTVALLFIGKTVITNEQYIFGIDFGASLGFRVPYVGGFANMQFVNKEPYFYIMLALFALAIALVITINYSKVGYYFGAIKSNQEAAEAVGVDTTKYKLLAQFICTFLTAVGGGFYVMFLLYLDPSRVLQYGFSIEILLFAIVGGLGTVWGPAVGAFILYPLSEFMRVAFGDAGSLSKAGYALIFMLIVFFMPKGVFPWMAAKTNEIMGKLKAKKTAKEAK